jgi:hypothetical protein
MIIAFWIFAAYFLDSTNRKMKREAKRLIFAIEEYIKTKQIC